MMKKLVVLLAVLIMTSATFALPAALQIAVNGTPWDGVSSVEPSDIISVNLIDTAPAVAFPLSAVDLVVSEGDYEADSYVEYGFLSIDTLDLISPVGEGLAVQGSATTIIGVTQFVNGDIIFGFDFHVPDDMEHSDIIFIDMLSGVYGNQDMSIDPEFHVEMHVTPEPMTVALLGLGGLFLRRRK